ncbi:hypothetical protein D3C81_2206010 [compost metagenome]
MNTDEADVIMMQYTAKLLMCFQHAVLPHSRNSSARELSSRTIRVKDVPKIKMQAK